MNCPNCGAENDADARFCAECGAPLENQDIEATIVGQTFNDDADIDQTIMSTPGELAAEEAKTVTVDQAKLAETNAEEAAPSTPPPPQPETAPPPPPPSPTPPTGDAGAGDSGSAGGGEPPTAGDSGDQSRRMWIIIGVVVLMLLCICCCCSVVIGSIGSDPEVLEDIMRELSAIPTYLSFV